MARSKTARGRSVRSAWAAVAAAEVLILIGLALVFAAFASSFQFCTGSLGCDGESSAGGGTLLLLLLGLFSLGAAPVAASFLSGWPSPVRAAALSVVAFVGALVIGAIVFDNVLVGLVVALGVGGSIAVRPPSPRAVGVRIVTVAVLVGLAGVTGTGVHQSAEATLVLAVLTLPAIGYADAISRAFAASGEGRHRT